ncbi:MAG TPA: TPM domain-containing protein [Bacteroidota bacterium]|nr:TPM domain-containing protein [Bacteroidota bacterium]
MSGNPLKSIVIASDPPLAEKQSRSAMHTVPGLLRHPSDFVERHPHNDYRVGRFIALTVLVLAVLLPSLVRADDLQIPTISRRVTDLSGTLSADETKQLEANLQEFESATSNQIAVLMIPSLNGESLEDFSISVTDKNKFGKKGRDNGVLLIIAKVDKKMRIEVGYGLEGTLTDALSSSIIRNEIAPRFRDGDYFGGIAAGIQSIEQATKGEYKGDDSDSSSGRRRNAPVGFVLFIIIAFLIRGLFWRSMYVGRRGVYSRGMWWGGMGGGGFGGGGFGGGGGFSGGGGGFGGGGASGGW